MESLQEMIASGKAYSPQDAIAKSKDITGKQIQEFALNKGFFDWDEYNLWGTGIMQETYSEQRLGQEDAYRIYNTVKALPLPFMLKEFLAKSSTTGIGGAAYLIPAKIYQVMAEYAAVPDIIEKVSSTVIPADQIPGATLLVNIAVGGSYKPRKGSSGAKKPEEEVAYTQATLDFSYPWYINFNIGNDLIEDSQFNLIEQHIRLAGDQIGQFSTEEILTVMASTTDGDGTLNTEAGGADTTTLLDLRNAYDTIIDDEFVPDSFIALSHVLFDAIGGDTTYTAYANEYHNNMIYLRAPMPFGLTYQQCESASLYTAASSLPTNCISYVYTKPKSYISGRKRWLRIENYSDPVRDLTGAVVSCRQDTISMYDDSVCKITET